MLLCKNVIHNETLTSLNNFQYFVKYKIHNLTMKSILTTSKVVKKMKINSQHYLQFVKVNLVKEKVLMMICAEVLLF